MTGRVALALLAGLAAAVAGCAPAGPRPTIPGDAYVLLARESTPGGLDARRETWTVVDTAAGQARFEILRAGARPAQRWLPIDRASRAAGRDREWVRVRVPAGTFECVRTTRGYEEREGRVMRVDEWWAGGVPVPVQRWTRWQGLPDRLLHDAPRRAEDLVMGAEWTVLEHAPRR